MLCVFLSDNDKDDVSGVYLLRADQLGDSSTILSNAETIRVDSVCTESLY